MTQDLYDQLHVKFIQFVNTKSGIEISYESGFGKTVSAYHQHQHIMEQIIVFTIGELGYVNSDI